ncbi:coiled-coil domain-containing protein 116 [Macrotis lagotis]|uniref:coiled-coil domain-containing protein 116 n=1 Tax=Macrotis lagotis TaxID=92651 RepID=UPI003D69A4ED
MEAEVSSSPSDFRTRTSQASFGQLSWPSPGEAATSRTSLLQALRGSDGVFHSIFSPYSRSSEAGLPRPRGLLQADPRGLRPDDSRGLRPDNPRGLHLADPRGLRPADPRGLRPADPRGLRPDDSRGLRPADPRGLHLADPRGLRPADPRGLHLADPRGLRPDSPRGPADCPGTPGACARQADSRGLRQADSRGLRQADSRGLRQADPRGLRPDDSRGPRPVDSRGPRQADSRGLRSDDSRGLRVPLLHKPRLGDGHSSRCFTPGGLLGTSEAGPSLLSMGRSSTTFDGHRSRSSQERGSQERRPGNSIPQVSVSNATRDGRTSGSLASGTSPPPPQTSVSYFTEDREGSVPLTSVTYSVIEPKDPRSGRGQHPVRRSTGGHRHHSGYVADDEGTQGPRRIHKRSVYASDMKPLYKMKGLLRPPCPFHEPVPPRRCHKKPPKPEHFSEFLDFLATGPVLDSLQMVVDEASRKVTHLQTQTGKPLVNMDRGPYLKTKERRNQLESARRHRRSHPGFHPGFPNNYPSSSSSDSNLYYRHDVCRSPSDARGHKSGGIFLNPPWFRGKGSCFERRSPASPLPPIGEKFQLERDLKHILRKKSKDPMSSQKEDFCFWKRSLDPLDLVLSKEQRLACLANLLDPVPRKSLEIPRLLEVLSVLEKTQRTKGSSPLEKGCPPWKPNPPQGPSPTQKSNPPPRPSPTQRSNSTQMPSPTQRSNPPLRPSPTRRSNSTQMPSPTQRSNSTQMPSPTQRSNSTQMPSPTQRSNSTQIPSPTQRSNSTQMPSRTQRSNPPPKPRPTQRSNSTQMPSSICLPSPNSIPSPPSLPCMANKASQTENASTRRCSSLKTNPVPQSNALEKGIQTEVGCTTEKPSLMDQELSSIKQELEKDLLELLLNSLNSNATTASSLSSSSQDLSSNCSAKEPFHMMDFLAEHQLFPALQDVVAKAVLKLILAQRQDGVPLFPMLNNNNNRSDPAVPLPPEVEFEEEEEEEVDADVDGNMDVPLRMDSNLKLWDHAPHKTVWYLSDTTSSKTESRLSKSQDPKGKEQRDPLSPPKVSSLWHHRKEKEKAEEDQSKAKLQAEVKAQTQEARSLAHIKARVRKDSESMRKIRYQKLNKTLEKLPPVISDKYHKSLMSHFSLLNPKKGHMMQFLMDQAIKLLLCKYNYEKGLAEKLGFISFSVTDTLMDLILGFKKLKGSSIHLSSQIDWPCMLEKLEKAKQISLMAPFQKIGSTTAPFITKTPTTPPTTTTTTSSSSRHSPQLSTKSSVKSSRGTSARYSKPSTRPYGSSGTSIPTTSRSSFIPAKESQGRRPRRLSKDSFVGYSKRTPSKFSESSKTPRVYFEEKFEEKDEDEEEHEEEDEDEENEEENDEDEEEEYEEEEEDKLELEQAHEQEEVMEVEEEEDHEEEETRDKDEYEEEEKFVECKDEGTGEHEYFKAMEMENAEEAKPEDSADYKKTDESLENTEEARCLD